MGLQPPTLGVAASGAYGCSLWCIWLQPLVHTVAGTLRLTPLPAAKFCGGHTLFVQQSGQRGECFNVHVTFTEGGIHGEGGWHCKGVLALQGGVRTL